jgi:hypothetical protein
MPYILLSNKVVGGKLHDCVTWGCLLAIGNKNKCHHMVLKGQSHEEVGMQDMVWGDSRGAN